MVKDIFKDMQDRLGLQFISDLPHYQMEVWEQLEYLPLGQYPRPQLEDFAKYVFHMDYDTFLEKLKEARRM